MPETGDRTDRDSIITLRSEKVKSITSNIIKAAYDKVNKDVGDGLTVSPKAELKRRDDPSPNCPKSIPPRPRRWSFNDQIRIPLVNTSIVKSRTMH